MRALLIAQARAAYIATGKTRNLTTALQWFVRDNPSQGEPVKVIITSADEPPKLDIFADHVRPRCKKCKNNLFLRLIPT